MHNYRFMNSEVKFHKGEDKIREFKDTNTKSGATLLRHFCSVCVRCQFRLDCILHSLLTLLGLAAFREASGLQGLDNRSLQCRRRPYTTAV